MKIKAINCPCCGARMDIDPGMATAQCEYCDSTIVTEGYYDSKTRAKAAAARISALVQPLRDRQHYELLLSSEQAARAASRRNLDSASGFAGYAQQMMAPLWAVIIAIIGIYIAVSDKDWSFLVLTVICAALAYPLYRLSLRNYHNKLSSLQSEIDSHDAQIDRYKDEIAAINSENDFSIVPESYQDPEALEYIADLMFSGQAYDLEQALALYKAESKRREEKSRLEAQLAAQKRQLDELQQSVNNASRSRSSGTNIRTPDKIDGVVAAGAALYAGAKILKALKDIHDNT